MLDVVKTVCELVAIPSVNPMGSGRAGPEFFEYRVTDYLQGLFERLGWPWLRQTVEPKRENIVARIDGERPPERGGPLILFEAHQDTVPVDGMTIEPWRRQVRDGRVYGRGACDIKGAMGAMLAALSRLADERPAGRPTIVMACTVNEEHGYTGALALEKLWQEPGGLIARRPDAAIVAEPTQLDVVVAHKGTVRWRCHTTGRAAHSSRPDLGDNAIFKMSRVLPALERYQREVAPQIGEHPLCGRPSLSVGTIHGGLSVNTVPDRCTIEIDRRLLPGEDPLHAYDAVVRYLAGDPAISFPLEHEPPFMRARGLSDGNNRPLAQKFLAAIESCIGRRKQIGVPYGTDAATYQACGIPSVVFGPGSIDQAHTADEWVAVEQLEAAAEAYFQFARVGMM
jgi:acetylornithine deacetylase/succinyl-diaminopimelate desuccinylase-like protein